MFLPSTQCTCCHRNLDYPPKTGGKNISPFNAARVVVRMPSVPLPTKSQAPGGSYFNGQNQTVTAEKKQLRAQSWNRLPGAVQIRSMCPPSPPLMR